MNSTTTGLTIVVLASREGRALRPAIRSVLEATDELGRAGHRAEIAIVLVDPDPETRAEATWWGAQDAFPIRVSTSRSADVGEALNDAVDETASEHVAFVKGDDLISSNLLVDALGLLASDAGPVVLHPADAVTFGAINDVERAASSGVSPDETLEALLSHPVWSEVSVTRRSTAQLVPFRSSASIAGFGALAWVWDVDTFVAGIAHRVVPHTFHLQRSLQRDGRSVSEQWQILPPINLPSRDASSTEEHRVTNEQVASPNRRSWRTRIASRLPRRVVQLARVVVGNENEHEDPTAAPSPLRDQLLRRLAIIDPAVTWIALNYDSIPTRARDSSGSGAMVMRILDLLDGATAIVAVPWLGRGGGDMVAANYARALESQDHHRGHTVLLTTSAPEKTIADLVPASVRLVQLDSAFSDLTTLAQHRALVQALTIASPAVLLGVNCADLTDALQDHPDTITRTSDVWVAFFAYYFRGEGYPSHPIAEARFRPILTELAGVITDNSAAIEDAARTLALEPPQILLHTQAALDVAPALDRAQQAFAAERFSSDLPFRLVWPHRLDREKRPESLVKIAVEIARRRLPVTIDVWGAVVIGGAKSALLDEFGENGIVYKGPYVGGLRGIPYADYHALLLTSESEGMPLVVAQAQLLGLPVVATNVGGVRDLVEHGVTGLLVRSPDDTIGFVDALEELVGSLALRRRLIEAAHRGASARHTWDAFEQQVARDLTHSRRGR